MPLNGGGDLVGVLGPDEGFWVLVVVVDELTNRSLKFGGASVDASLDGARGEEREPSFDLVEPRAVGRDEVEVDSLVPLQPPLDLGSGVRLGFPRKNGLS